MRRHVVDDEGLLVGEGLLDLGVEREIDGSIAHLAVVGGDDDESAVVVLERRAQPAVAVRDHAFFRQVVRGAFAYRRKTLANSLALALPLERSAVTAALARLGLDTEIRGEQLDLAGFAALADALGA